MPTVRKKTVTVKYPYHPLYGQRLEVVGSRAQNGESHWIILAPGSIRQYLPAWMTEDAAEHVNTVSSPVLPVSNLLQLHVLLKPLILSYADLKGTPDRGDTNGGRNQSST